MKIKVNLESLYWNLSLILMTIPEGIIVFATRELRIAITALALINIAIMIAKKNGVIYANSLLKAGFLYAAFLLIVTFVRDEDVARCAAVMVKVIGLLVWGSYQFELDYFKTIKSVAKIGWCYIVANFLISIVFSNGIYVDQFGNTFTFLGLINNMEPQWVPLYAICIVSSLLKNEKSSVIILKNAILFILVYIPNYIFFCQTGMVLSLFIFASISVLCMIKIKSTRRIVINPEIYLIPAVLFFVYIINIRENGYFYGFFQQHRTMLSRLGLWRGAFEMVKLHPIFGYGMFSNDAVVYYNQWRNLTPHNLYLMVALWGGVIGLILFAILLIIPLKKIGRKYERYSLIVRVYQIAYISMMIYFMVEVTTALSFFYVMQMAMVYYFKFVRNNVKAVEV